jgi:hypothetical protein
MHDWARVHAGTYHYFHTSWLVDLARHLNQGLLPTGYYAMGEQIATRMSTDVLTLRTPSAAPLGAGGGSVVLAAPPRLSATPDARHRPRRVVRRHRTLVIRHVTDHTVVALIEIVSPANIDRVHHVRALAEKIAVNLQAGIHVLLIDPFAPTHAAPHGMHGAVWEYFDSRPYVPPPDQPLTLTAYAADEPRAYIESLAVGNVLPEMPLFLTPAHYVNVPLEATYQQAYAGMPSVWREVLDAPADSALPS